MRVGKGAIALLLTRKEAEQLVGELDDIGFGCDDGRPRHKQPDGKWLLLSELFEYLASEL